MSRSSVLWLLAAIACTPTPPPAPAPAPSATASEPWRTKAAGYLDARVGDWLDEPPEVANFGCAMNCHTTFPAVLVRDHLPAGTTGRIDEARARFEARLSGEPTPFYGQGDDAKAEQSRGTEAVLVAAALSFGPTDSPSREPALARMWSHQRERGDWPWLDFGLEPWEHDPAFGVAMAALAAGSVNADAPGLERLRGRARALATEASLHDRAGLLWASSRLGALLSDAQAEAIAAALRQTQDADGGVALSRLLGDSGRADADGYATAWVSLALCASGYEAEAAAAGRRWLRAHQRRDGSWPGRSVNGPGRTAQQYMTDAATAYAVLALDCEPR